MASFLGYKSKSGYANIETGINKPPLMIAHKIAQLLDQEVQYLFFENEVHESRTNRKSTA
ncbi:hypothetical protein BHU72_11815 [Desulfuribacillus stibiiarsenatis]|uniref:HTH cro/C1-type domain-containing protein n=2 Tax=Desulfuribacillus stibiiarsenatis TaxID=1390249 RepID=A0A1E5L8K1_9FIRM|nr:hypothetical protein BHU72_11815 [Desulfuribacillus stibiiarsenatis]